VALTLDAGVDFAAEYEAALQIQTK